MRRRRAARVRWLRLLAICFGFLFAFSGLAMIPFGLAAVFVRTLGEPLLPAYLFVPGIFALSGIGYVVTSSRLKAIAARRVRYPVLNF